MENGKYWATRPRSDLRMDWRNGAEDWIKEYIKSVDHPHRQIIVDLFKKSGSLSLAEVGCNAGPNLIRISNEFPHIPLSGIDANMEAIEEARLALPNGVFFVGDASVLPWGERSYDCVLADACYMYLGPEEIKLALQEANRVAKKAIIICDWFDESLDGVERYGHWARDYAKILGSYGFEVEATKITRDIWPSENWFTVGYIFLGKRKTHAIPKGT